MAGEREQQFRTTPSFQGPQTNPAATMRTNQYQATEAAVQGQGASLASIGSNLANFFGATEKAVEEYGSTRHSEEMADIARQREARAIQAQADHAEGKSRDASLNVYQDYKGAFDLAVADDHALQISADLEGAIRDLPNAPGTDLTKFATSYIAGQMRGGTGDPAIDGRIAYSVKRRAEQMIAQKTEQIAQTSEANIAQAIDKDVTGKMMTQGGVTTEQTEGFYASYLGLTKGDVGKADRLFASSLERAIYNPGHANSTLAALRESGFAQRNPDVYREITEKAWAQTNRVKSVAAGREVQDVNRRYQIASAAYTNAQTIMPVAEQLSYIKEAADVDSRHGVGMHQFPWVNADLDKGFRRNLKDQTKANAIARAWAGESGGDVRRVLSEDGNDDEYGKVMSKQFIPAVSAIVEQNAQAYPALAATKSPQGSYDFLATRESARDTGHLLGVHPAAFGYSTDDNTAAIITNGVMGGDPIKAINAVELLTALQGAPGGDMMVKNILRDPAARARLDVFQAHARDSGGIENAVRTISADKAQEERETKELRSGVDWKQVTGDPEAKSSDIVNRIQSKSSEVFLKDQDRSVWYRSTPKATLSPALSEQLQRLVSRHLSEQRASLPAGSKPDLDKAVTWSANEVKANAAPLIGQGGTLRYVVSPYGDKGRQYNDPVAIYQGQRVYAGMKMQNRLGQEEDPQKTFSNIDRPALLKAFPGYLGNPHDSGDEADVYLNPPDQKTGLMPVMKTGQVPLAFYGGMGVRIGDQDLKVPVSPHEADTFFRTNLPKGYFAINGAPDSQGRNTYRIAYGYRLVGDDSALDKAVADKASKRQEEIEQIKAAADPETGAVQNQRTPIAHPNYRK